MSPPDRVAAIDCGTNSLRLLIAECDSATVRELTRVARIVRLGEGVDRTGRLASTALARAGAVLGEYRALIDAAGVRAVRMVATSAVRDARNRDDFDDMVERVLGQRAEVLSGAQEAELSFLGASAGWSGGATGARQPAMVVVDIGGGSSELVRGFAATGVAAAISLDVGSVRMTERHLRHDPPTGEEVDAIEGDVRGALEHVGPVGWSSDDQVIGVAGTVTTVAALALRLERYESSLVHGAVLTRAAIDTTVAELLRMDHDQRAARAVIHPGRVDVIAAGAVVLRTLIDRLGADRVTVSEHDILDGIARGLRA